MKKIGIVFAAVALLLTANGISQEKFMPFLLKESLKKSGAQFKTGFAGSYPQNTVEYSWMDEWILLRTIETSYTGFGEPSIIEYNQDGNKTRDLYSYDAQHQLTESLSQAMTGDEWVNQSRILTSYTTQGYLSELRFEEWVDGSWFLEYGSQIAYEMDGDRIVRLTAKSWNPDNSNWDYSIRETYTYPQTGSNYLISIMEFWEEEWIPMIKTEYTWSGSEIKEYLTYNYEEGEWILSGKTVFEITEDSTVMTSYNSIGENEWIPSSRTTIEYDSHGNDLLDKTEMYIGDWMIIMATRFQLTYSGNDLTERITEYYGMSSPVEIGATNVSQWRNVLKEVFSNFASMGTGISRLSDAGISVFPNPAGQQAVVRLSLPKAGLITISVTSMSGQKILEQTWTATGSDINHLLDLNGVKPGSYILTAIDNQGQEIGKTRLIKE